MLRGVEDVLEYLKDFDDPKLTLAKWLSNMYDAVRDYNEEFNTDHNPYSIVSTYSDLRREDGSSTRIWNFRNAEDLL